MAGTLFVYCTYVSDDPWPLIGFVAGVPLSISLLVDMFRIPGYIAACSERLRARLKSVVTLRRTGSKPRQAGYSLG